MWTLAREDGGMTKRLILFSILLAAIVIGGMALMGARTPEFDASDYGAVPNDGVSDKAAIALAVADAIAYEAANDTTVYVRLPKGTLDVDDGTTAPSPLATDGGIIIPSTTENIVLSGNGTTIRIGSNGISTSAIRCFADNCVIEGITVDPNRDAAPVNRDTDAGYAAGTLTANGTTTIAGSGTTWTKEMVGRTISIQGNATIYTITGFTSTTSLTLDGTPTGGAGLTYNIWPFKTKDNSGIELNGCENSVIRDCFILDGDKTVSSYNTGQVSYDHTGGSSERLVTLTGGSWPGWVSTDAAITIAGTRYSIASVPTTTTLTLSATSSTDVNNPGTDVSSTSDWQVEAYPTTSTGENDFLIVNGRRNRIERCLSVDCAFSPFFVSGTTDTETVHGVAMTPILDNGNYITDCTAVNFKGNGIRVNSGRSLFVRGFICYTLRNDGRSGILADAGSSQGDLRTERVFIEDSEMYCNPTGNFDGASSTLKIASVYQAHVKNCKIECGSKTNSVAVRLEDNIRSVFLEDCYIRPNVFFTPASATGSIFQGAITGHSSGGGSPARVRYTVSGTPAGLDTLYDNSPQWGRELNVRGSGVTQYNGPQEIYETGIGYIETERAYIGSGTLGSGAYGQTAVGQLKMRNCTVDGIQAADSGVTTVSHYGYWIQNCNAYEVDIEGCTFNQIADLDVQYGGIFTDYLTDNGWSMFRVVRNKFTFWSDKTCRVLVGGNSSTTEFATSGRSIWYGNEKNNRDSGSVLWLNTSAAEREILFNSEGENPRAFRWSAYPVAAHVTWAVGDIIWNTAPSGSSPTGWVCIVAGSPGTWVPLSQNYTLALDMTELGTVGNGEDNLITYTLPANTLNSSGETLEIEAGFSFANNTHTKQAKLYFGSVALYASGASGHQDGGLVVRAVVTRDASNISKVLVTANTSGSGTPFPLAFGDAVNQVADLTAAVTIKGTGEVTGTATDNDVVMEYLRVRKVP